MNTTPKIVDGLYSLGFPPTKTSKARLCFRVLVTNNVIVDRDYKAGRLDYTQVIRFIIRSGECSDNKCDNKYLLLRDV